MAQITVVSVESGFAEDEFRKLSESERKALTEQFKKLYGKELSDDELEAAYKAARTSKSGKGDNTFTGFSQAFPAGLEIKIAGVKTILTKVDNNLYWSRGLGTDTEATLSVRTLVNEPKRVLVDGEWRMVTLQCDLFDIAKKYIGKSEEEALKGIAADCDGKTFVVKRSKAYQMLSRKGTLYVGDFPLFDLKK